MTLTVIRTPSGYVAAMDPPHGEAWSTISPLAPTALLEELGNRGVHSTDATDALDAADVDWARSGNDPTPTWSQRHDDEVRHRRGLT